MDSNNEAYQNMQAEHLSMLTSDGHMYLNNIASAATLLERDYLNEIELSAEEKGELFKMLIAASQKYIELIQWSIKERQNYIDSTQ